MSMKNMSIRVKLVLVISSVTVAALAVGMTVITFLEVKKIRDDVISETTLIARMAAEYSVSALAFGYKNEAEQNLSKLVIVRNIESAAVYDADGRLFAAYFREGTPARVLGAGIPPLKEASVALSGGSLEVYQPMSYKGRRYGTLRLIGTTEAVYRRIRNHVKTLGYLMAFVAALVFVLASRLQNVISKPILRLAEIARNIPISQDYAQRVDMKRTDELGALAEGFNSMLAGLQARIRERDKAEELLRRAHGELERKVLERTSQLKQANAELEAFSYSVSHDLRAPLRGIDGFSALLEQEFSGALDKTGQDYLRRIRRDCVRMSEIIDNLQKLSSITRQEMSWEKVDLAAIAAAIIARLRESEPGRAVEFYVPDRLEVHGDPGLLAEVMENLLNNAWKFTRKTAKARIEMGFAPGEGGAVYFVRDNGSGFDMAYVNKLFRPFQRLHAQDEFPGSGIGLSIVRRVIERHGGRVWAEAAENTGAAFYFTLRNPENSG